MQAIKKGVSTGCDSCVCWSIINSQIMEAKELFYLREQRCGLLEDWRISQQTSLAHAGTSRVIAYVAVYRNLAGAAQHFSKLRSTQAAVVNEVDANNPCLLKHGWPGRMSFRSLRLSVSLCSSLSER